MRDGTWMLFYYNPDGAKTLLKELESVELDNKPKLLYIKKILENFVENGNGNFKGSPNKG